MSPRGRRRHRGGVGGYEPQAVVEDRATRIWELHAAGWTHREIAADVGVSQPAVSKCLARTADRVVAARTEERARAWARQQARNDFLYRTGAKGYERSQRDQTRKRQRQVTGADGSRWATTIEAEIVERDGDPRFLEQMGRAVERQAELWGFGQDDLRSRRGAQDDPEQARRDLARRLARLAGTTGTGGVDEESAG